MLEEISSDDQAHVADLDKEHGAAAAISDHDAIQTELAATDSMRFRDLFGLTRFRQGCIWISIAA